MAASLETDTFTRELDKVTFDAGRLETSRAPSAPRPIAPRQIFAAIDDGPSRASVLAWTRSLARAFGAGVRIAHVIAPPEAFAYYGEFASWPSSEDAYEAARARALKLVAAAVLEVGSSGLACESLVLTGDVKEEIAQAARRDGADLVVVGAHDHGSLRRLFLGSVAQGVVNHCGADVLVARGEPRVARILAPVDGSRESKRAAALAREIARAWKARLSILHVVNAPELETLTSASTTQLLRRIDALWTDAGIHYAVEIGRPAECILATAATEESDLIVMGSRGLGRVRGLMAGSVSSRVAREASASVLLAREVIE